METVIIPQVLLFNMEKDDRGTAIRSYLENAGIRVIEARPDDYARPLREIFGIPWFGVEEKPDSGAEGQKHATAPEYHRDEMLIMCAFTREMLDGFLKFFKEKGLEPVALKAMLTPVNMNWTPAQLHEALAEEHRMMHG